MRKHVPRNPDHQSRVRQLREDQTYPERLLWRSLRGSQLAGLKFRRQHPIGRFVVDFCCMQEKLAIELDGVSHDGRATEDEQRTRYLNEQGWRVIRFLNDDVLADLDAVLEVIVREATRSRS